MQFSLFADKIDISELKNEINDLKNDMKSIVPDSIILKSELLELKKSLSPFKPIIKEVINGTIKWMTTSEDFVPIISYKIYINDNYITTVNNPQTEYTTNLFGGKVQISSINKFNLESDLSDSYNILFPISISYKLGRNSISIDWEDQNSYLYEIKLNNNSVIIPNNYNYLRSFTFTTLDNNTYYDIQVIGKNQQGENTSISSKINIKSDFNRPKNPIFNSYYISGNYLYINIYNQLNDDNISTYNLYINNVLTNQNLTGNTISYNIQTNDTLIVEITAINYLGKEGSKSEWIIIKNKEIIQITN